LKEWSGIEPSFREGSIAEKRARESRMTDTPTRRIGLPWYRREDYPRIRDM